MGIRRVIVEGPDGGGKSTLIRELAQQTGVPIAERASRSETGPIESLFNWYAADLALPPTARIYDRHPLISEPIYAPIARGVEPQTPFDDPEWLEINRRTMATRALLVVCLPPLWVVKTNVKRTTRGQMPGVEANIVKLWNAYDAVRRSWSAHRVITYDYTNHDTSPYLRLRMAQALRGATRA